LLKGGSDRDFRALVHDLLTVSSRMELVRGHLGARMGVSGPQYSVLVAIAHLQGESGVSVSDLAEALHVSNAFIAYRQARAAPAGA
jgi:DNA-binding MarR family transcriptional regulator